MSKLLESVYKNQSFLYKVILYIISVSIIVMLFPRGGKFKFGFQKGKPWQYENLYAPFDFSIKKSAAVIASEKSTIKEKQLSYFKYDVAVVEAVNKAYEEEFALVFFKSDLSDDELRTLKKAGKSILDQLYLYGILKGSDGHKTTDWVYTVTNHEAAKVQYADLLLLQNVKVAVDRAISKRDLHDFSRQFHVIIYTIIKPNLSLDVGLTNVDLEEQLSKVSLSLGTVDEGRLIVAKGEVIDDSRFAVLSSLRKEYESEIWSAGNYYYIISGYSLLVALVLLMLLLFLKNYKTAIFENNKKVTFIFINILFVVFLTTFTVTYNEEWVFAVPLCLLPLVLKTFFDSRTAFYAHVLAVLLLGFVVPNSFEYIFLQITAGIVTILSGAELYKRANLFVSVGQVTLTYIVGYFAFHMIQEGQMDNVSWLVIATLALNGLLTLFALPLIYIYEKLFGLVSDATLLELSDTNSKLLKELSNKAPGTFHHSLQVANLAEAAANEIGANSLLVRVGALYHDVGKMEHPTYFTENQITNVNPHDELDSKDSAKIIIGHVIEGIEIAKKHKLPDRLIDFIRVHHGTSLVYYFYKKEETLTGEADESLFRYPGPKPFSKETAILMMSDAIEAASKSLKDPNYNMIHDFVERIITGQMQSGQFINANITFKEVEIVKKVLKRKLVNIYHLRIEYPE